MPKNVSEEDIKLAEESLEKKKKYNYQEEPKGENPPEPSSFWIKAADSAKMEAAPSLDNLMRRNRGVDKDRLTEAQTSFIWALMRFNKNPSIRLLFNAQRNYIEELTIALMTCDSDASAIPVEVADAQHEYIGALTNALEHRGVLYRI